MTISVTPRFTLAEARHLAQDLYGLAATASPLPSERDQNFLLRTAGDEQFVLKIAKSDEERDALELQNAVLKHVARRAPALALPRTVAGVGGDELMSIQDASGRSYFVRLMSWLDGEIFVDVRTEDHGLLATLGAALAELDLTLLGISHPAMHRELQWDLKRADLALQHLPLLPGEQRAIVRHLMSSWAEIGWTALRFGIIHGDANDYNVLVRQGRVIGFLDFGDVVHSAIVCDLAIALAYAMLDQPEPLTAGAAVIAAYQRRFPLTTAEIDAIYPLTTARLCMSLCYAAHNARAKPGDNYQLVTAAPAWQLLRQLAVLPEGAARDVFRRACQIP